MAENKRKAGRPPKNATPVAKRAKTATPARVATPKEQTPVVEAVEVEREATPLPSKIAEVKELPALSRPQPLDLPDDEYQSIGASGVLAASLERSRQKWVSGSFFDKYWTKVSTRKDAPPPPPNNPTKAWMKEIGLCTITIEPLILEATVFYVKEPGMAGPVVFHQPAQPRQQSQQSQSRPQSQQAQQRQQSQTVQPRHQAQQIQHPPQSQPRPQSQQFQQSQQPQAQYQQPPQANLQNAPNGPSMQSSASLLSPSPYGTPYRPQPAYQPHGQQPPFHQSRQLPHMSHANSSPMHTSDNRALPPIMPANNHPPQVAPRPPPPATPAPAQQSKSQPDPVVQMLATRASSDHELKSLMKVVATGHANQEQLRIFQRHIDELTAIMNRNKAQAQAQQQYAGGNTGPATPNQPAFASNVPSRTSTPGLPGPPQILPRPGPPVTATPPLPQQQQRHANQYTHAQQQQQPHIKQHHPPQPPPTKYYPPANQPSLPIVLEFQGPGASPDRFKFPEYSILEFLSPYMLLASFLVIRPDPFAPVPIPIRDPPPAKDQPDAAVVEKEKPKVEESSGGIYEPITLKITVDESQKGRDLLEFIRRCVKPAAETKAWMTERMLKCTRAERKFLALRLPHKSQIRESSEDGTKESTPVVVEKKKAPRKSMDKRKEEEKGQEGEKGEPIASESVPSVQTPAAEEQAEGEAKAEEKTKDTAETPAEAVATPAPPVGRRSGRNKRVSDVQMADA